MIIKCVNDNNVVCDYYYYYYYYINPLNTELNPICQ